MPEMVETEQPTTPEPIQDLPNKLTLSKDAINKAILAFEVSWSPSTGFATYNRLYRKPVVPDPVNTESGVTVGIGYDCGQTTAAAIKQTWASILPMDMVTALMKTAGLKKQAAVNALALVKNVDVPIDCALQVFYNNTLFSEAKKAFKIYPSLPKIHPVEQTVFVGLVYNRGAALEGDRRTEMKALVKAIENDDDKEMGSLIRSMSRLWPNSSGLRKRREAEAALVELADAPIPENDKLILNLS